MLHIILNDQILASLQTWGMITLPWFNLRQLLTLDYFMLKRILSDRLSPLNLLFSHFFGEKGSHE